MTTHLGDDGYFIDDETEEAKGLLPHSQIVIRHACGRTQLIQVVCADPLCVECSKIRAARVRAKWLPVMMAMHRPKMITLTMKSQLVLEQARKDFQSSFRRLLDLRLGKRGLPELIEAALDFVHNPKDLGELLCHDEIARQERWETSIDRFRLACERKLSSLGRSPRMRDMIGPGFASYEITYKDDVGWHFHRHCTVDGEFIPWPVLVAAWTFATQGAGSVVDIRSVDKSSDSMKELVKYCTKPWEIPDDKKSELRQAVKGMKRIWPLGGAKPVEPVPLCPFCKQESCKAHRVTGMVKIIDEGFLPDGTQYRQVWDDRLQESYLFTREHGIWAGVNDPVAAHLDLIHSAFACHSQGPPGEKASQETLDKVMSDLFASVPVAG
jgi:hypothetical protein